VSQSEHRFLPSFEARGDPDGVTHRRGCGLMGFTRDRPKSAPKPLMRRARQHEVADRSVAAASRPRAPCSLHLTKYVERLWQGGLLPCIRSDQDSRRTLPRMTEPNDRRPHAVTLPESVRESLDHLFPIVYDELRRLARRQLAGERRGHTLNTTDLVHEAFVKLAKMDRVQVRGRGHFFALAGRAMRRVLVDHAGRRNAAKRGGERRRVTLDSAIAVAADRDLVDVLELERALQKLESMNARYGRVVECRIFAGLSVEETAAALEVSPATVHRDWSLARAWLNRELDHER
jgi:RNA polymerase sigma-70 factor, ECF subfamily